MIYCCRHLPTKSNREAWALEKEASTLILQVVKERQAAGYEKDLLQMILEGARNTDLSPEATDRFIVDNCKNIYLAGYETTAVSATWCLMLLASNQKWQERVRAEVLQICQGQIPDNEMVRKMKQVYIFTPLKNLRYKSNYSSTYCFELASSLGVGRENMTENRKCLSKDTVKTLLIFLYVFALELHHNIQW